MCQRPLVSVRESTFGKLCPVTAGLFVLGLEGSDNIDCPDARGAGASAGEAVQVAIARKATIQDFWSLEAIL